MLKLQGVELERYLEFKRAGGTLALYNKFLLLSELSNMNTGFQPKRKKLLTRPVLKFEEGKPRYVKIQGAVYVGKEMKAKAGDDKKREPANLADVIDLETGEPAQIIISAVVKSVLDENYPNQSYVDKCFAITKQGREAGKQYFKYNVEEIEDPGNSTESAATPIPTRPAIGARK